MGKRRRQPNSRWPLPRRLAGRAELTRDLLGVLEQQVPDPELRKALTPDYPAGCKRIIVSDDFLPALQRANVTLELDAIRRITSGSVLTSSGRANVRAVWLFSRNDALANVAVVAAAGLVFLTRRAWPDLVLAAAIALLFLHSACEIVRGAP